MALGGLGRGIRGVRAVGRLVRRTPRTVLGYLTYNRLTISTEYAGKGAISYERGTPVSLPTGVPHL